MYSKKQSYIKYSLAILVLLISVFNIMQQDESDYVRSIVLAFANDKKIICDKIIIDKKDFNIVTQTGVFVGKQESKYKNYTILIQTCKVDE